MWSEVADMVRGNCPCPPSLWKRFSKACWGFPRSSVWTSGATPLFVASACAWIWSGTSRAVQTAHCGHVGVDRPSIRHGKLGSRTGGHREWRPLAWQERRILGRRSCRTASRRRSRVLDRSSLRSFNLERSLREQTVVERYPWWDGLQAVQNGKVAFADGNLFFYRSGMTVSQTAEIIAEILHGVSFGEKTEGVHWHRSEANVARDLIRMGASRT